MRARLVALAVAASAVLLAGCASQPSAPQDDAGASSCGYSATASAAREVDAPPAEPENTGTVEAVLETSAGDIPLSLDADAAPCTVGSFVSLATQGYFDDTDCHRLTTAGIFVLQCGDPTGTGSGGPGYRFDDELDGEETYEAGTVAMANAGPGTNGSQFFLVYEDSVLPPAYTVFGQMSAEGVEVVREIAAAGTATGEGDGAPADAVTIGAVRID